MNLSSFIGNEKLLKTINSEFMSGRLPHAIILQGEEGLGKKTLAKLIARGVLCKNSKEGAPCGICPSCIRVLAGSHPDIKIIQGTGKSLTISTDSVKDLNSDTYRASEEGGYNVYLIFAEKPISEVVQNKLLKIIEEPPLGTLFIITVKSADALLPTIKSRSEIHTLRPVREEEAMDFAMMKFSLDEERAKEAVRLCSGNIGKIEDYIQNNSSGKAREIAVNIAEQMISNSEHQLLATTSAIIDDKNLFPEVLTYLEEIFRDALVIKNGWNKTIGISRETAEMLSNSQTMARLYTLPDICNEFRGYFNSNGNMSLIVTAFCAKLRKAVLK